MSKQKYMLLVVLACVVTLAFSVFADADDFKDEILKDLAVLIEEDPGLLSKVIPLMGAEYIQANEIDRAIDLYKRALVILPDNEYLLKPLADLYNKNGDKDQALAIWKELSETQDLVLDERDITYLQDLEDAYKHSEGYEEMIMLYDIVLRATKDKEARYWADLGLMDAYERLGRLDELTTKFEKALARDLGDINQYIKLAKLYLMTNKTEKAIELYDNAVRSGAEAKDTDKQLLSLYQGIEGTKRFKVYHELHRTNDLISTGAFEEARGALEYVIENAPDDKTRQEAQKILQYII